MMKTTVTAFAAIVLAVTIAAAGWAVVSVQAQSDALLPLPPSGIVAINAPHPGEVSITWNAVDGANYYRVGWIADPDYRAAGNNWLERFAFVDVAGKTTYNITRLTPGTDYWFIVASKSERYGTPQWSPSWVALRVNDDQSPCPTEPAAKDIDRSKEAIIFGDLNWSSALLQNRIAQYIVEKGYGYPTEVKFGATLPLFQGLGNGDVDLLMEIWLPNQDAAWGAARADGSVISLGTSLGYDWQSAFVIPAYLQERYPGLDSVEDLKDPQFKRLFATPETGGRARLVSCVIGWACEVVNAAQIEGYGLSDHVDIVNPGDGAALNADLYGAYENQEPWLGYQWGTNDPALKLDLVRLEEPAYSDQCWFTTKACAYEDATILIAANPGLIAEAPDVVAMMRRWDFNINIYRSVVRWQGHNPDADTNATALWWLNNNANVWSDWVTDDAAVAIQAALRAGEIPDGWPTY